MNKKVTATACLLIGAGIILGAIGAHIVKPKISQEMLFVFEKAVRYQLVAAFGLLIVGINAEKFNFSVRPFTILNYIGILVFSGGLYLYSCHEMIPAVKFLAHIVPIGGMAMISSWIVLAIQMIRSH